MNIMILGAGIMQIPALKEAKKQGHFVICVDGNPKATGKEYSDIFYPVDLKDKQGLLEVAEKFHNKNGLHGVFTVGTDFSSSVAYITEKLGLPGIKYQRALDATDKVRMRTRFKEEGVPSPRFLEYSLDMNLTEDSFTIPFPVVVKPVDSMGARGVKRVDNFNELNSSLNDSIKHSRTGRVIIEEYLEGPEFSLDALIYNGEIEIHGVADRDINFPPYFVEMGHTIPSNFSQEDIDKVVDVFKKGIVALGIDYGCAKGDIKLTKKGAYIGEIAARLSGGYMSGWTYPYYSGVNLIGRGISLALGETIEPREERKGLTTSERAIISIPGVVKSISLPDKKHKDIKDTFLNIEVGSTVSFPINNVQKCGNVITLSDSYDKAVKQGTLYTSMVDIRLEAPNFETDTFLFNKRDIRAFDLDYGLLDSLTDEVDYENGVFYIKPVKKILSSRKKDWYNRTVNQVIKEISTRFNIEWDEESNCGLDFYMALLNGSLQGVTYYFESLEI